MPRTHTATPPTNHRRPSRTPLHRGLQHYQDNFWTYDGPTMSCVGLYKDVIQRMPRRGDNFILKPHLPRRLFP